MVTTNRTREVAQLLALTRDWAASRADIDAIGLAGSWARDDARMDSDFDLVILCADPAIYLDDLYWIEEIEEMYFLYTRDWGALTELRFKRPSGLEIEFGFAPLSWAAINPIDEGTLNVILNGFSPLYDPHRTLAHLLRAARQQTGT